jgi:hypothetical protein
MERTSINLFLYHIVNDSCFIIHLHSFIFMIAATLSFFGEQQTKTQLENEISLNNYDPEENYKAERIDKSNPQWNTFLFSTFEDANKWIEECKKIKTFSTVIAIRNLNTL